MRQNMLILIFIITTAILANAGILYVESSWLGMEGSGSEFDPYGDLQNAMEQALFAGIRREQIILDPGIGFGKNAAENIRLLHRLETLGDFGLPVLVGVSRKAFIGSILGQESPEERLIGTVAAVVCSVLKGAHIVRIHDVAAMRQAVAVADAVENGTLSAD